MSRQPFDAMAAAKAARTALDKGDAHEARRQLELVVASGQARSDHYVALALACRAMRDDHACDLALEQALRLDPQHVHGLILKGDTLAARGSTRAATSFYGVASALAARRKDLPPTLAQEVRRAEAARDRINADIEAHLRKELAVAGYDPNRSSERFSLSLDLLTGRKQIYLQQPRAYYCPELPQIQFYPRSTFPWLSALEDATDEIRQELRTVLAHEEAFVPYVQTPPRDAPASRHALLNKRDWSAFFLWKDGEIVPENAARCPRTLAALAAAPFPRIRGHSPSILFSLLRPGARIAAHTGFLNCRLICHLPLIVPGGCRFRVGNDERAWEEGKAWVFDDTIEHEAWNSSNELRVVLIFDVWRPELAEEERNLVTALLEAVDTYPGGRIRSEI